VPRKKPTETQQARRFAVILAGMLLVPAAVAAFRGGPARALPWLAASAAVLACAFLALPLWLRLFRLWMKAAEALAWVTTRVLLGAFFYVVLTPIALLARPFRDDPLDLAWKDGKTTYWVDREEPDTTMESAKRMF
jgi:hypothetical protein